MYPTKQLPRSRTPQNHQHHNALPHAPLALSPSHSHPNIIPPTAQTHAFTSTSKLPGAGFKSAVTYDSAMSDSDASVATTSGSESDSTRRCFCGNLVEPEGIYCSQACARSSSYSSLCKSQSQNQPQATSSYAFTQSGVGAPLPSLGSSISCSLSRDTSASSTSTSTSMSNSNSNSDWEASHYRRLNHADLRRQERKQERRRRREEGSMSSTASSTLSRSTMMSSYSHASSSSISSSRIPDLIGGGGMHSRNASTASTASLSSAWSGGGLSRNPSSASTTSSRRGFGGGGMNVDEAIMEDEDEEEMLTGGYDQDQSRQRIQLAAAHKPMPTALHRRRQSMASQPQAGGRRKKPLEPFGMGKDLRDVLEDIIKMEKEFQIEDSPENADPFAAPGEVPVQPSAPGLFTATFDRPPRTPSPAAERRSSIAVAPGAPNRGHRRSLSNPISPQVQLGHGLNGGIGKGHKRQRQCPPSMIRSHQSSLSESHTALYLATASPESSTSTSGRKSESPKLRLKARNSLTFTPGPDMSEVTNLDLDFPPTGLDNGNGSVFTFRVNHADEHSSGHRLGSSFSFGAGSSFGINDRSDAPANNITPSRRRPNLTPGSGVNGGADSRHPTMSHWRFPSAATPTKRSVSGPELDSGSSGSGIGSNAKTNANAFEGSTPTRRSHAKPTPVNQLTTSTPIPQPHTTRSSAAHLLWPPAPPSNLAPSLFPMSPGGSGSMDEATPESAGLSRIYSGSSSDGHTSISASGTASSMSPPTSGLRLGELLGSGSGSRSGGDSVSGSISDEMEVDDEGETDDAESDDATTAHGHGYGQAYGQGHGYLPVYLEAEGFRSRSGRW